MQDSTFLIVLVIVPLIAGVILGLLIRGKELSFMAANLAIAEQARSSAITLARDLERKLERKVEEIEELTNRYDEECEELRDTVSEQSERIVALEENAELNDDGETWKEIAHSHWLQLCQQRAWQAAETWKFMAIRTLLSKVLPWDDIFEDEDMDPAIMKVVKDFSEVYSHYNSYRHDCEMWMRETDYFIEKHGGDRSMCNCIRPTISSASRISALVEDLQKNEWNFGV
ncbi:hypothetical protein MWH03_00300 [Klebsiella pneumoniae]|nr:hypothetical protein [Klebsiella pneumoniae]